MPPGVTVFDAASWNGIAIDSTCGGHGTCKKCKVQIVGGAVPISRLDVTLVLAATSSTRAGGWPAWPRRRRDLDGRRARR